MTTLPTVPEGLTVRPMRDDDVDAVLVLLNGLEERHFGEKLADRSDLAGEWSLPGFTAEDDGVVVEDDGTVVAASHVGPHGTIELHSTMEGTGLALLPTLLDWTLERARERGTDEVSSFVGETDHGRRALLVDRGFTVHHTSWILRLLPHTTVTLRELPEGYAVRPYTDADAEAVHTVVEDAFSAWEGRTRHTFEEWAATTIRRPGVDTDHFRVATFHDEVVGACVVLDSEDRETWVHNLAVSDRHRGKGLAQQMLAVAYEGGWERGNTSGGLATDSRTGALDLYERLGMRVRHTFHNLSLRLS